MGKKSDDAHRGYAALSAGKLASMTLRRRGPPSVHPVQEKKIDSVYSLDHFFLRIVGSLSVWLSFCITGTASTAFSCTVTQFCVLDVQPVRQLHTFASSDSVLCNSYTLFAPRFSSCATVTHFCILGLRFVRQLHSSAFSIFVLCDSYTFLRLFFE